MTVTLPLLAFEPLSETGLYARDFVDDLTENHQGYTHTISAMGGFDKASFTISGNESYLQDWFDDGLMRRVVMLNPEAIPVWEGYVNRLGLTIGSYKKTKTIESMINRVYMKYSPLDLSVVPPIALPPTTIIIDDLDSQAKWGVKATLVNGGENTDEGAYNWARVILNDQAIPQVGEAVNTSGTNTATLKVDCNGYLSTLKWLPYISSIAGTIQAHQVIQEIIEFFNDTNSGWISTDFGLIDYNFRIDRRSADEFKSCWDLIINITKRGGLGGERWVVGLYQNRQLIYKPAEDFQAFYGDAITLTRSLRDPAQRIFEEGLDTEVKPWDMLPDRILRTVDL